MAWIFESSFAISLSKFMEEEDRTGALETGWGITKTCEKTQGDRDGST